MADIATDLPDDTRPAGVGETYTYKPENGPYEIRFWHNGQIVYRFETNTFTVYDSEAIEFPAAPDQSAA